MDWVMIIVIGGVLGLMTGFVARNLNGMPEALCVFVGILGSLLGGALFGAVKSSIFGTASFYIYGVFVSVGLLGGAILAFTLTSTKKRL